MIESDTGKKNAQKLMISITIVKFAQIAGYDCGKIKVRKTFVLC